MIPISFTLMVPKHGADSPRIHYFLMHATQKATVTTWLKDYKDLLNVRTAIRMVRKRQNSCVKHSDFQAYTLEIQQRSSERGDERPNVHGMQDQTSLASVSSILGLLRLRWSLSRHNHQVQPAVNFTILCTYSITWRRGSMPRLSIAIKSWLHNSK